MAVKTIEDKTHNVLEAAQIRLRNVFSNGIKVYMAFSCGKDSLVMSDIVYQMILRGEIDKKLLTVIFVDEEGLYRSMVENAERWQRKFKSIGVPFHWLCLPFKQVSVIDHLSSSESWITFEPGKEDVWIRKPPKGAITDSPYLKYPGEMNYQTFDSVAFADGIMMVGVRTQESIQRLHAVAAMSKKKLRPGGLFYPIYDWTDNDIWLYIKENNLEFPEIYMRLYEAGCGRHDLRLCAFFGDNGTRGLRWIAQTDPELWERIEKREPNAYLVLLYWDSEMFRRTSSKRRELEKDQEKKDYRELCRDMLYLHPERYNIPPDTKKNISAWKSYFVQSWGFATQKDYKDLYEALLYGDPKRRVLRALWTKTFITAHKGMRKEAGLDA